MRPAFACLTTILACGLFVAACGRTPASSPRITLRVLAAASLTDVFTEIGAAYERAAPGTTVEFSFAGSNQLRLQLEQGSPGDVFVSADRAQMDAAAKSSVILPESTIAFTSNELAILVPRSNPANITSLADLGAPSVTLLVADVAVPAGRLTAKLLEAASQDASLGEAFAAAVTRNIVSREQNASALGAKVALGEADAAISYATEAFGARAAKLKTIPLPESLRQRTEYLAAVTSHAASNAEAQRFIAFLKSAPAQAMLATRGFTPAEPSRP